MGAGKGSANVVGRNVARLRFQRSWTQKDLVIQLQLAGCEVTRQIIAHIEAGNCAVTDGQIVFFAMVFHVNVEELFPHQWRCGSRIKSLAGLCPTKRPRKSRLDEE